MVRICDILETKVFEGSCFYFQDASLNHNIRECEKFKSLLQQMMDCGEIEFFEKVVEESINVITDAKFVGKSSLGRPKPLTIFFENDLIPMADMRMHLSKLTVEVTSLFPYMDS